MLLLLRRHGRPGLGHLHDVVDNVLLLYGTGQRNGVLQVVEDVVQLRRLEERMTEGGEA